MIFNTEPVAKREFAQKETAMLVESTPVEKGTFRPTITATGVVQPSNDISLSPRISGEVVRISPSFMPGSFVKAGEVLVQIDPADYRNTVEIRKSDLSVAKANLEIELGRRDFAEFNLEKADGILDADNKRLIKREPQLNSAKASVQRAEALLKQAELDLGRTTIRAPFDAHIISRNVNKGSQVAVGDVLGRLVGIDEYWVMVNVPVKKINWLQFPQGQKDTMLEVKLRNSSWPKNQFRYGRLSRLIGTLTDQTRFAQVLVTIPDPFDIEDNKPPVIIGAFLEAAIPARQLDQVVRLNRDYLRKGETVWAMQDGKLDIRNVDVLFQDKDYAYIGNGLTNQDQVVTSSLSTVVNGAPLRIERDSISNETAKLH